MSTELKNGGEYTVGIVGCGKIGFWDDYQKDIPGAYTHFRAFAQSEFFRVVAIAEPNESTRRTIEREYGIAAFEQYGEMLAAVRPDIVCIATPDDMHPEVLRACVPHQPKVVFCEKPLAGSLRETTALVALYKQHGIGLQINFTRRFLEEYREIGQWVHSKEAGTIQHVLIYYSRGLLHNGSHYIDALLQLLGEPHDVRVLRTRTGLSGSDPTASVLLQYGESDVYMAGMQTSALLTNEIDVIGTHGRLHISTDGVLTRSCVQEHPLYGKYTFFAEVERKRIDAGKALPNAVANIYGFVQGREQLLSPGENSIRIFELIHRIREQI